MYFNDNRKLEEKIMQAIQLHEDKFLKISWEEKARVIGIDWKEATSSMTDEAVEMCPTKPETHGLPFHLGSYAGIKSEVMQMLQTAAFARVPARTRFAQ